MLLFLKNLLYTLLLPAGFAVYVPLLIVKERAPRSDWGIMMGLLLFLAGGVLYVRCLTDFATHGRGTPAPIDAPRQLVIRGIYNYVRNPLYVAVLIVMLGWTILFESIRLAVYLALAAIGFHLFVVLYEEPRLHRRFGRDYAAYCERVGRWWPHLLRRQSPAC